MGLLASMGYALGYLLLLVSAAQETGMLRSNRLRLQLFCNTLTPDSNAQDSYHANLQRVWRGLTLMHQLGGALCLSQSLAVVLLTANDPTWGLGWAAALAAVLFVATLTLAEAAPRLIAWRWPDRVLAICTPLLPAQSLVFGTIATALAPRPKHGLEAQENGGYPLPQAMSTAARLMNAALEAQEQSANKSATPEVDDDMFSAALDFNRIRVGEFMVPRTEIVSFPAEGSVTDLRALFVETNLSRIVITRDSLDDLVGLVHTSSLLDADPLPQTLVSLIQPLMVVPETLPANRLLGEFNRARRSIAAVVDEFGGTAGLVTLEDLVEVIIGEIEDEYDEPVDPSRIEERLGPGTYRLSARLEVEYLNRQYELGIPEGEYSTLGGYLLHLAERIPEPNEVFLTSELKLTVLATRPNRIEQLRVERRDLSAEAPSSL